MPNLVLTTESWVFSYILKPVSIPKQHAILPSPKKPHLLLFLNYRNISQKIIFNSFLKTTKVYLLITLL